MQDFFHQQYGQPAGLETSFSRGHLFRRLDAAPLVLGQCLGFSKKDGKSMGICLETHMGVSKNRVFTCFYPKSSILIWVFHYKPSILGEKDVFFGNTHIQQIIFTLRSQIPGSSKCLKFVPKSTNKNLPKGSDFTYLEDPDIS